MNIHSPLLDIEYHYARTKRILQLKKFDSFNELFCCSLDIFLKNFLKKYLSFMISIFSLISRGKI